MSANKNNYQHIIIGQGLAGSLLAYRLIRSGQSVLVIDNNHQGSSSKVAAGIINPITGYRLTTNKVFAEQQKVSYALYAEMEALFAENFLVHLKQFRLLKSDEQVAYWNKRIKNNTFMPFTGKHFSDRSPLLKNDFGIVEIHKSARVDVPALLNRLKQWLIENTAYLQTAVKYTDIKIDPEIVSINNITAKNIVFCEGYQAINNPWWQHLPFKLSKGEILTVKLNQKIEALLNWRQWVVPKSGTQSEQALLGANYEWGDFKDPSSLEPTLAARDYLLMRLETNTHLTAAVTDHKAGIRPTPTHRFPYIGAHKAHSNLYCFNGFGSKGCVSIPYYSHLLTKHLLQATPLPDEVTKWL